MDIKLGKSQLSKRIQSAGFVDKTLGNIMGNLGKNAILDLAASLTKDVLPKYELKQLRLHLINLKEK